MKTEKEKRPLWLIPLFLVLAGIIIFLLVNPLSVRLALKGPEEVTVEYGSEFTDPGAAASFGGPILLKDLASPEVRTNGTVDVHRLGDCYLEYSAAFLWSGASVCRTVHVVDTVPPVITLQENADRFTHPGEAYEEEGYAATDNADGDLTAKVEAQERDGKVYYSVTDSSGNRAEAVREIQYADLTPPEITLEGGAAMELSAGTPYVEPGYRALDGSDGDLTEQVTVSGAVNPYRAGVYELTYTVEDSFQNTTSVKRTVTVVPKPQADRVSPGDKVVYLTFDDGPGPHTARLLDLLDQYNVKVTFFVVGTGCADLIAEEAARGHSVGIHSASHNYKRIYASEEAYFTDLQEMSDTILDQTGTATTLLRFPGGSSNTVSRFNPGIMARLAQDVTDMGYQYFDWNVSSGDAGGATTSEAVAQNVISGIQNHNVSIVLQHDIKGFSVDAVEEIISWGLANGYTFLPLSASSPTAHHRINN